MTDYTLPAIKGEDTAYNIALKERVAKLRSTGDLVQPDSRGGVAFVKFNGNDGSMTVGRDQTEITADQKFAVPLEGAFAEISKWQKKTVLDRKRVQVLDGPPPAVPEGEPKVGDLPKPNERDGWDSALGIRLFGIDGDLKGTEVEYASSASGQSQEIAALIGEMTDRVSELPEGDGCFNAIVTISSGSYYNKTYSKDVYFPQFKIHGFTDGKKVVDVTPYVAGKKPAETEEESLLE